MYIQNFFPNIIKIINGMLITGMPIITNNFLNQNSIHVPVTIKEYSTYINYRLDNIDQSLNDIDTSFGYVDTRLNNIDTSLSDIDDRLDNIDISLDNIDNSYSTIEFSGNITGIDVSKGFITFDSSFLYVRITNSSWGRIDFTHYINV